MAFTPKHSMTMVKRHAYFVPDGATARDLSDAVRFVLSQVPQRRQQYDDAFHVRAFNEGIELYFETTGDE